MDTDHPYFQQAAPEYEDSVKDRLKERIDTRWRQYKVRDRLLAIDHAAQAALDFYEALADATASDPTGKHFQHILAYVKASATPLLTFDAICYAFGLLQLDGFSMHFIGSRHGISREAFSKHVIRAQTEFNIAPRHGMRPVRQRELYREIHRTRWDHIEQDAPRIA